MKILWVTWKDFWHPEAGGAELVAIQLIRRMIKEGHHVTMLTCGYEGAKPRENREGFEVIRIGNSRYLHPLQALAYFNKHLKSNFDILIEEVNGAAPYFTVLFENKAKKFMFYHQLGRRNWLYEIPKPFSYLGYHAMVPLATRLASLCRAPLITVSESTKAQLAKHGFKPEQTSIISEGLASKPLHEIKSIRKFERPTILSFGAMRAMKRTLDHVKAFEIAKQGLPDLQMKIAGGGANSKYGIEVLSYVEDSPYKDDIEYLGRISDEEKFEVMRKAHIILQTAVEEGWGLTITEAASQGTPAVAYNVDGLRDSIRHGQTGILTGSSPGQLAEGIIQVLEDKPLYDHLRQAGWEWSKQITFDQSFKDFKQIVGIA